MRGIFYLKCGGNIFKMRGKVEDALWLLETAGEGELVIL